MKTQPSKPMRFSKSSDNVKTHSITRIHQERREKLSNLTLHLKQLETEEMKNPGLVAGKKSSKLEQK